MGESHRRTRLSSSFVTLCTLHFCVSTGEGEPGSFVGELCDRFPSFVRVALEAIMRQLATVFVGVAREAFSREPLVCAFLQQGRVGKNIGSFDVVPGMALLTRK